MLMSDYVRLLQAAIEEHGDLPVVRHLLTAPLGAVDRVVRAPEVREVKRMSKCEHYEKVVTCSGDVGTGELVFRL